MEIIQQLKKYAAFNTLEPVLVKRMERSTEEMEEYFGYYYRHVAHAKIILFFVYDNLCLQT
jgi:hypothetical protein